MSTWAISVQGSGSSWNSDGTIPRPHADLETIIVSTAQKVKLADGSNGFVTPEVKSSKEAISLVFLDSDSALRTKLNNYIANGDNVKITTHTGETFTGKIINIGRVWLCGVDDSYDLKVTLERID
jgi:hypothetical protein